MLKIQLKKFFVCILISLMLLVSCSSAIHETEKDGPPPRLVNVTAVPNAIPKHEPLSKYGNPPVYAVNGKNYRVLSSSKGYHVRGLASWYGWKFHKKRTSSGEPYNMFAMTAASKTLPLPTYVQVTNLRNGRKIVVKVNDRGPFHKDRLLDLSYVAATKLDIVKNGTALVDIKTIEPSIYYAEYVPKPKSPSDFSANPQLDNLSKIFVQVGVFAERDNADKLRERLVGLLNQPTSVETTHIHSQPQYRVKIGPLLNNAIGYEILRKLGDMGLSGVIRVG